MPDASILSYDWLQLSSERLNESAFLENTLTITNGRFGTDESTSLHYDEWGPGLVSSTLNEDKGNPWTPVPY